MRRSLMTGLRFGRDAAELRGAGLVVGTPAALVEQLGVLAEAGVQRVMLQWLDLNDLAAPCVVDLWE